MLFPVVPFLSYEIAIYGSYSDFSLPDGVHFW